MSSNGSPSPEQSSASNDPGAQQIGMVYAQALVSATENTGETVSILEEFDSFIEDLLDKLPRFAAVLTSVLVKAEEKAALLDRTLGPHASKTFLQFLKVVALHERLDYLRSMRDAAHAIHDESRGHVSIEVRTAEELDPARTEQLRATLAGMLDRQVDLMPVVDPGLIGGLIVRVGDTVYDASVSTRLEQLRREMINRSVHEIQSRRDRFRSTTGD